VAHSEGAIYVNKVYNLLDSSQRQSINLVYIAPASKNMSDGSTNYLTNQND
jgi:hypothetical protein